MTTTSPRRPISTDPQSPPKRRRGWSRIGGRLGPTRTVVGTADDIEPSLPAQPPLPPAVPPEPVAADPGPASEAPAPVAADRGPPPEAPAPVAEEPESAREGVEQAGVIPEPPAWVSVGARVEDRVGRRRFRVRLPTLPNRRRRHGDAEPAPPTAVEVHPRIAVRRDQVADAAHRRRRRILLGSASVAGVVAASVGALFSPLLDLDHLAVSGVEGDPAAEVLAVSELERGVAMFAIRPAEVRRRVEDLPWVAHAEVSAEWPDSAAVHVLPHRPVAVVARGDAEPVALATASGRILAFEDVDVLVPFTAGLPVLRVPEGIGDPERPRELRGVLAVLEGVRPATRSVVGEARVDDGGQLTLLAGPGALDGAEFELGNMSAMPEKVHALEAALGGSIDLTCVSRIDVSVPSRMTVQRDPACVVPGPEDAEIAEDR